MNFADLDTRSWSLPADVGPASHHARHTMSRRAFMGTMAGAAGAAVGAGLMPSTVLAAKPPASDPVPTTSTFEPVPGIVFHLSFFGAGLDPSSITDFNGFVGVADVRGTGVDNHGDQLLYDTDMRFMSGVYVGVDGRVHKGTFGFV